MSKVNVSELPPSLKESWEELLMPVDTNIKLEDVILSEENRNKIAEFIKETSYRDKLLEYKLDPMNRLLFYGASGTGKTYLAKALSNHLNYTMLYIDIAKSLSEGNVADNISRIFELGNYLGNCVIFLDECDSVAWNRDAGNADSGVVRRATNSIFQHLDQMNKTNIFISATNMLHRLDAAFERRFDLKLMFTRPNLDIDEVIKHFLYPSFNLVDDVNNDVRDIVKKRASQYVKLSYYELEGIVKRAMKNAILRDSTDVHTSEIYDMLAINMNFKVKFNTHKDNPEIFENKNSYDPTI